jgi:hypothetical protein
VTGLLCEQLMLARYCVCVIDPEGDFRTLEAPARRAHVRRAEHAAVAR